MIQETQLWELPKISVEAISNLSLINQNLTISLIIGSLYLLTNKRTAILGMSFLVCEIFGYSYGLGIYNKPSDIYVGYLLIFCYFAIIQLYKLKSNYTAFCKVLCYSISLAALFIYASYDADSYPEIETLFYLAYPSILLFLHVCLILSFYNTSGLIKRLGGKLRSALRVILDNYTVKYFCYTISYRFIL